VQYLRKCWYQAGWISELSCGAPLARTIAEIPLVFIRDEEGRICTLLDRCPHRFAPLSAGRLENGRISCGYHGLTFDGGGRCVHNPHGAALSAIRVQAFATEERHQAFWVWLGEQEAADKSRIPELSYIDSTPAAARITGYLPTRASFELLSDNILDLSHADYLHAGSLGGMMTSARTKNSLQGDDVVVEWESINCAPPSAFLGLIPPPNRGDIWIRVRWTAPAVMSLWTYAAPTGTPRSDDMTAITLHNMTPETRNSTHYFYCVTRPYRVDDLQFSAELRAVVEQAFAGEDKPMLERQQMRIGDADFWSLNPVLMNVDTAGVQARRALQRLIASERAP
jgi:phenylpropionate dioxygenase-like ring-hydroxylating dioxygenase large terminal subunit